MVISCVVKILAQLPARFPGLLLHIPSARKAEHSRSMDVAQTSQCVAKSPALRQSISKGSDFSLGVAQKLLPNIVFFPSFLRARMVCVVGFFDTYLRSASMRIRRGSTYWLS